jgi:hypothetical protein
MASGDSAKASGGYGGSSGKAATFFFGGAGGNGGGILVIFAKNIVCSGASAFIQAHGQAGTRASIGAGATTGYAGGGGGGGGGFVSVVSNIPQPAGLTLSALGGAGGAGVAAAGVTLPPLANGTVGIDGITVYLIP